MKSLRAAGYALRAAWTAAPPDYGDEYSTEAGCADLDPPPPAPPHPALTNLAAIAVMASSNVPGAFQAIVTLVTHN
ncbi:hypothetical protein DBV05_g8749 [Lasiodiplodia theobromae]|uniref:Uncharacterized protein n=1 Tax=Lasiodiplodia theobromae TaxID=45133 RepID=A0A5N5D4D1_9PEZI|nr:hypothetical protein DBV05_g8749 [Lasiodiplodia theobromae]